MSLKLVWGHFRGSERVFPWTASVIMLAVEIPCTLFTAAKARRRPWAIADILSHVQRTHWRISWTEATIDDVDDV